MSTPLEKQRKLTPDEYLAIEEKAEYKSEYWDGVMVPLHGEPPELVGGTINHNIITLNVAAEFRARLRGRCQAFASDMKIWVNKRGKFYYPDASAVCGEFQYYNNRRDTIENPTIVVEVSSDSTVVKDRTEKLWSYHTLESLRECVLIAQDKPVVEQYVRQEDGGWQYRATIGIESKVVFPSIGIELKLSEIYENVVFEAEEF